MIGHWMVGDENKKGTSSGFFRAVSNPFFSVGGNFECPHEIRYTWEYFASSIGEWLAARQGMSIWKRS